MDFAAFDTKKMEEYKEQARKEWGSTDAYQEYERKAKGRNSGERSCTGDGEKAAEFYYRKLLYLHKRIGKKNTT